MGRKEYTATFFSYLNRVTHFKHPIVYVVHTYKKRVGQTQCRRLPHEWGLGKEKTEASLPPAKSAERLLRTRDLVKKEKTEGKAD